MDHIRAVVLKKTNPQKNQSAWSEAVLEAGVNPENQSGDRDSHLLHFFHQSGAYWFLNEELAENHTRSAGFKCSGCSRTVLRTKRAIRLGTGIRLVVFSCGCATLALPNRAAQPLDSEYWKKFLSLQNTETEPEQKTNR